MSWHLNEKIDFQRHNAECESVWRAFRAGEPYRVPITIGGSIRNLLENPALNVSGYSFEAFFTDPEVQIQAQLAYQKWVRYNVVCDREMGPPSDGWHLTVDFQNSYDQGWFGCPIRYHGERVPDTLEILKHDKGALYALEPPDPTRGNLLGRAMEFFEYMHDRCRNLELESLPVHPPATIPGEGTDGPFTVAAKMRGTAELCLDMYEDPRYFHDLLDFITDNLIRRMKAIRRWRWDRDPDSADRGQFERPDWGFADDSVAILSPETYEEFVLPYHQKLAKEFSDGGRISIHLCGDATHLFPLLKRKLNVYSFDTGFPVDFGAVRNRLGPDVRINGGPSVMVLKHGPSEKIREEVERICSSGVMTGGRFVLREGNNMAPCTPVEHVAEMYRAGKVYGRYDSSFGEVPQLRTTSS